MKIKGHKVMALAVDLWTTKNMKRCYVGLTAHFLENYDLKCIIHGLKLIRGVKNAINIKNTTLELINEIFPLQVKF